MHEPCTTEVSIVVDYLDSYLTTQYNLISSHGRSGKGSSEVMIPTQARTCKTLFLPNHDLGIIFDTLS